MITQGAHSTVELVVEFAENAAAPSPAPIKSTEPASEGETLPDAIASAVKATLSQELGDASLQVGRYSRETWSNGCLGLGGGPAEGCLAALTEGWRVELIDTTTGQNYFYRTNSDGTQVRREIEQQ